MLFNYIVLHIWVLELHLSKLLMKSIIFYWTNGYFPLKFKYSEETTKFWKKSPNVLTLKSKQCTEVRFASFLSGGFITAKVVNPPERKLVKRTSVQCQKLGDLFKNLWPSQNIWTLMHFNQQFTNLILSYTASSRWPQTKKRRWWWRRNHQWQGLRNFEINPRKKKMNVNIIYLIIIFLFHVKRIRSDYLCGMG